METRRTGPRTTNRPSQERTSDRPAAADRVRSRCLCVFFVVMAITLGAGAPLSHPTPVGTPDRYTLSAPTGAIHDLPSTPWRAWERF
ncbi:hypothetical protein GCM10017779_45410 [Streptomyces capillispiralis]|nr:hypothetical protein GCM10017779_45410 [Streptomyces capillispiralis]